MKKSLLIIVLFISILFLTGCNGTVTRELREAGFNLGTDKIVCSDLVPEKEGQATVNKIKYMMDTVAIAENGEVYEMSLGQKYSNNEHCKKIDVPFKVSALMDYSIAKGTDKKYYYLANQAGVKAYSEITVNDDSYRIYDLLLSGDDVLKVSTVDQSNGIYYVLLNDGNIYKYIVARDNYDSPYTIKSKTIIYNSENYGGKIIDFNYDVSNKGNIFVKTADAIYRMQVANKKQCDKYADVECKYKFMKDEILTKYYKTKILYYGPGIIITTYGRTFN